MVGTLLSNAEGVGSIPGQGAKMPHTSWPCNKFNFLKRKTKKKSLVVAGGGCGMIKYDNQLLL